MRASHLIQALRFRSHSGRLIRKHRALRRLDFAAASWLHPVLLAPGLGLVLVLLAGPVTAAWEQWIRWWLQQMALPAGLTVESRRLLGVADYLLVRIELLSAPVHYNSWAITLTVISALTLASYLFGRRHLALVYLVFLHYLLVLMGLVWFVLVPAPFPHDILSHTRSGLEMSLILVLLVPWLLAPSLYVFDLPLWRKVLGTLVTVTAIAVFAPLQYLLHAVILHHGSLVFMPLLYVLYGLLPNVLIFVALYAWTLSWEPRA
jgi:hypothetical protein